MQMPSWHLAKPAKTRGSSILKTLGLLGNWVWGKSEWFIWRQRTNQTKTWTSYETNIPELFSLIIFHIFQDIIQMNLNCWCFLVHTISSTGSSGTKHCSYWYVVKSKKGIYIIYTYEQVNTMYLSCCLETKQFHWYSFILFIPLKFTPNHQIVKEVSFPNHASILNCRRIVVPLVSPSIPYAPRPFHMANSLNIHSTNPRDPVLRAFLKKTYNAPSIKSARTERTCANLGKYPSTLFLGGWNWLVEKGQQTCVLGSKVPWVPYNGGWENQPQ